MDARLVIVVSILSMTGAYKYRDPTGLFRTSRCGDICEEFQTSRFTNIPRNDDETLLSKEDFDKTIVGRKYSKFYHAMTKRSWDTATHFFTTIWKINGTANYRRTNFADYMFSNECYRSEYVLEPLYPESDKAVFTYENYPSRYLAIFSSCPSQYYIKYFCSSYGTGSTTCLVTDTMISVYVPDSLHDIPLHKIVDDVFKVTGVRFGAPNFMWTFTHGQNVLCNK